MDNESTALFNAARSGDVNTLNQLLEQNPCILSDYHLNTSYDRSPLIIAIKANHRLFVRKILILLKPDFLIQVNHPLHDGLSPLDVASACGHLEIVEDILAIGSPEICRRPGRDGRTAMNGRVEVIDKLISVCPASANDVTDFGESVLHLAAKYFRVEVFRSMLEKFDMREVVNLGNKEGNTVLHYAASRKQSEIIELLIDWNSTRNILDLNAVNEKGLTAMDILDIFVIEPSTDLHYLRETLRSIGVKQKNWLKVVKHFQFNEGRDSPGEARAALLLVAALIFTVTFQAAVNPPSFFTELHEMTNSTNGSNSTTTTSTSILKKFESNALVPVLFFLIPNTIALTTATTIIDCLTVGLPFQRELRVSSWAMMTAYGCLMGSTSPVSKLKINILAVTMFTPVFLRWLPYLMKRIAKHRGSSNA